MSGELKECCVSGHIHSGTPGGQATTVYGLPTYIANPKGGSKEKTVMIIPDIFGWETTNIRLVADEWAAKGYRTLIPDIFAGDSVPLDLLTTIPNLRDREKKTLADKAIDTVKLGATFGPWTFTHRDSVILPIINDYLKAVRADPEVKKIVAVGFCFGGRHAILAADKDGVIDAAVAYHPSQVSVPSEINAIMKPTFIAVGDEDDMVPMSQVEQIKQIIQERKETNHSEGLDLKLYHKAVHGFAVRGDLTDDHELKTKEDAFKDALEFLDKVL
ncbi:Predicted hydrolase related to dienelactone hydrolase [Phaffia rhodozyma]|uniref:Predicted hydrolase related to dienelactone hydrolase n=1 Tax=Phaffia rhodozyma TaxID=264483 RepID=A0A0F7SFZ4_PHARH|nr:Predicted hydrolase related to dienelactone hydrolase [Phaffia rhodozyma]